MKTTLDRFGRVVIPKKVRDDLGLKPGTVLQIEEIKQEIILKPVYEEPQVVAKDGVLVFLGTKAGDIDEAIRAHREKRLSGIITLAKNEDIVRHFCSCGCHCSASHYAYSVFTLA